MNTIRKLKNIKACDQAKEFVYLHREQIKKAALPLTVVAAVLFFWFFSLHEEPASKEAQPAGEGGEQTQTASGGQETAEQAARIYVDISGCVKEPGVYEVSEGTRVFQLIEEAGGLTEDADIEGINRAEPLIDGQKIVIYERTGDSAASAGAGEEKDGRININTADSELLQEIPGVGPVTAEKIIRYREENGRFAAAEDLKNVSGIGEKTFDKLKDHIRVY